MRVLVTYASKHGSTAGIAERIASALRSSGLDVEACPVEAVGQGLDRYDGVVIGAAAYMFHWLKDATRFAERHSEELRGKPVWLFSSGPLGTDKVDKDGRDVIEVSRPKEFDELEALLQPRGVQVFFGAFDPDAPPIGLGERFVRKMPASKNMLPAGDFRDWEAIDTWAAAIANEMAGVGR